MPALRLSNGTLLVPEKASETWIQTDPEHLIKLVGDRQTAWDLFVPMVRVLKLWEGRPGHQPQVADRRGHGPQPHARRDLSAPQALYRFFNAMEGKIGVAVMDPAGLCGPTEREIDWTKAGDAIRRAARASWEAVTAQADGDTERAACLAVDLRGGVPRAARREAGRTAAAPARSEPG